MTDNLGDIRSIRIEDEMRVSCLDYAMSVVDQDATVAFLRAEATQAAATDDGHRAWVVRDSLEKLRSPIADELRRTVDGVRKRPNAPTTSRAAETAAAFIGLGVDVPPADRPIVERP